MCVELYRWSIELEGNINSTFSSSLGSTLLFIEKATIDPLYLWVITHHLITTPQCLPLGPKMMKCHVWRSHDITKGSNNIHIIKISNEYQIYMITYDKTSRMSWRTKVTTHKSYSCSRSEGYWIALRIWTYNLPPNKPTSINYKI